ncbi:Mur ligase family protein [Vagococcus intermedius]|uniref:Mur ligase family protein n=1 Tax=Vagococcus intermedius TaxID=2991418 RepID=A0AAF0CT20_9ENTE|nr:Mur ligase family protein [Vagococcus intermedius]WEG72393.1 Mur ligase family protein [Vagococcus intermedius]WEG74481.1 Mur ligase family protein [Vagococcus intermedius]
MLTVKTLNKYEGYFANPDIAQEINITRLVDRSGRLVKPFKNVAMVITYPSWSMDGFEEKKEHCGLIITEQVYEEYLDTIPQYIVPNTEDFMYQLALDIRPTYTNPVVGITGSVGKSSTRKMITHLLTVDKPDMISNIGNHNNRHSGPYHIVKAMRNPDYVIVEISAEILIKTKRNGNLAKVVQPDIAIMTKTGGAHLARYQSNEQIAEIKSGLLEEIKPNGTAILNSSTPEKELAIFIKKAEAKNATILTYSLTDKTADIYLIKQVWEDNMTKVTAMFKGKEISYSLSMGSDGMIENSFATILTLDSLGLDVASDKYLQRFATFKSLVRNLMHREFQNHEGGKVTVMDDTHNAAMPSMINAIKFFTSAAPTYKGNKVLIISQVADLGDAGSTMHRELVPFIADSGADYVLTYSPLMENVTKEVSAINKELPIKWFENLDELVDVAVEKLDQDSFIVMKGSRSDSDFKEITKRLPLKIIASGGKKIK